MADEEGAVTHKLRKFTETDQVNFIINSIPDACTTVTKTERALQDLKGIFMFNYNFCSVFLYSTTIVVNSVLIIILILEILDRYQEQPHLLDPYLGNLQKSLVVLLFHKPLNN